MSLAGTAMSFASSDDLTVTRFDSDGVPTVQTDAVHFDLSAPSVLPDVGQPIDEQTPTAATLTIKLTQAVLAADEHLLIERTSGLAQETVLTTGGGFNSRANERAYDAIYRKLQELEGRLNRGLFIHPLDADGYLTLDLEAADREDKIIAFDADGAIVLIDMPEDGAPGATGATGATGPTGPAGPAGSGAGDVLGPATNTDGSVPLWNGANTKTLKNATAAEVRTALGLGSAALLASSAVFQVANNLSEGVAATMRSNLGLGSAALLASSAVFQVANNLSEGTASTMRTNLGIGSAGILDEATTAEFRANTTNKVLTTDQVWAGASVVTLTDAATIAVDFSTGFNFSVTLGGNRTLGNPTNMKHQSGHIQITQDGTGSRTLAYGANWEFAGGIAPVLSTAAGTKDVLFYQVLDSDSIYATLVKAVV